MVPPTVGDSPWHPEHTPIRSGFITRNCCLPILSVPVAATGSHIFGRRPGRKIMEILVCPIPRIPLSALLAGSNGKAEPIQLVPAQLQELPEDITVLHQPPSGLHSGFSVRLYCLSL